jgi:hypothetical protein
MSDFGAEYTHVPLQCDSTSAISVTKNPVFIPKQAHRSEVSIHESQCGEREDSFGPCTHNDQLADIFTKPLDQATFTRLRGELGVYLIS